jgi:hypothetical protein
MSVLGIVTPDAVALMLGTGYERFVSPTGISGLARVSGKRLDILAVNAIRRGTGQFRSFIARAKQEYETVCVWEIANPLLDIVLPRYGFRRVLEIDERTGEWIDGHRYDKEANEDKDA